MSRFSSKCSCRLEEQKTEILMVVILENAGESALHYWLKKIFILVSYLESWSQYCSDITPLNDTIHLDLISGYYWVVPYCVYCSGMVLLNLCLVIILSITAINGSEVLDLNLSNFEKLTKVATGHTTGDWLVKVFQNPTIVSAALAIVTHRPVRSIATPWFWSHHDLRNVIMFVKLLSENVYFSKN